MVVRPFWRRFIPTRVGNALWLFGFWKLFGGSSPRVWGTQRCPQDGIRLRRFIPTRVGNAAHRKPQNAK